MEAGRRNTFLFFIFYLVKHGFNNINQKQLEPESNGYKEQKYNQRKEPPSQQNEALHKK